MDNKSILDALGRDMSEEASSRREALRKVGRFGAGLALAAVPAALGSMTRPARAQAAPSPWDGIRFAQKLEHAMAEFFQRAADTSGLLNNAGYQTVVETVAAQDAAHAASINRLLGSSDPSTFDFTANGRFDPFVSRSDFFIVAQLFKDLAASAYKGQLVNMRSFEPIFNLAVGIHTVEARHAQQFRRVNQEQPWIEFAQSQVGYLQPIYVNENNVVQAGVDVRTVTSVSEEKITEAFDEGLTLAQAQAILDPFIA